MKMIKALSLVCMSSVYVMTGACVVGDSGYSFFPQVSLQQFFAGFPLIGT